MSADFKELFYTSIYKNMIDIEQMEPAKRGKGRPTNNTSDKFRWRITYLNPASKEPLSSEEYKSVDEVAVRLGTNKGVIYEMHKHPFKRWEFTKVEKI